MGELSGYVAALAPGWTPASPEVWPATWHRAAPVQSRSKFAARVSGIARAILLSARLVQYVVQCSRRPADKTRSRHRPEAKRAGGHAPSGYLRMRSQRIP